MTGLEVRIDSSRPIFVTASADDIGAIFAEMTDADQVTVLAAMVEHMRPHRSQWDYISIALEQDVNRELRNELREVLFPDLHAKGAEIAKLREALSESQRALSMLIAPHQILNTSTVTAFAAVTAAEARARAALEGGAA